MVSFVCRKVYIPPNAKASPQAGTSTVDSHCEVLFPHPLKTAADCGTCRSGNVRCGRLGCACKAADCRLPNTPDSKPEPSRHSGNPLPLNPAAERSAPATFSLETGEETTAPVMRDAHGITLARCVH